MKTYSSSTRSTVTGRNLTQMNMFWTGSFTRLGVHLIKHGNQIANDASLARFGVPDTPDHHPHKVGGIFRAEFLHNVGTMKLDRARTDIEGARCFPAGGATHNLSEHYSFARRQ